MAEIIELTEKQKEILASFREIFKNDLDQTRLNDSVFLLRWLIARDFDLQKAVRMLKNSLSWRWEQNIDFLLEEEFPQNYAKDYPYLYHGHDKDGRIILLFPWGRWDCRKACENGEKDQLVRYTDTIFEKGLKISGTPRLDQRGSNLVHSQVLVLCNMEGFSYRQLAHKKTIDALLDLVRHYESHYPETMFQCIIFNAPWIFTILFNLMRQILPIKTISKVSVFRDKDEWQPAIQQLICPRQLPKAYGGVQPDVFEPLSVSNVN